MPAMAGTANTTANGRTMRPLQNDAQQTRSAQRNGRRFRSQQAWILTLLAVKVPPEARLSAPEALFSLMIMLFIFSSTPA